MFLWELQCPNGQCTEEVWVQDLVRLMCCVLGQDTFLSQCLSPPRRGRSPCEGLAFHSGGGRDIPSHFMPLGNWKKPQLGEPRGLSTDFAFTFIPVHLFAYFAYFCNTRTAVQMHVGVWQSYHSGLGCSKLG